MKDVNWNNVAKAGVAFGLLGIVLWLASENMK